MRSALVAAGIALTGTALGAAAYTVVSSPTTASGDAVAPVRAGAVNERTACKPPDRIVRGTCVTVVHVRPRAGGSGGGSAAPATPTAPAQPVPPTSPPAPPAAPPVTVGHDAFDDHGGDHDDDDFDHHGPLHDAFDDHGGDRDDAADRADDQEDDRDDYLDDREDAIDDRDDRDDD